jgi:hypothetical protein
MHVQSSHPTAIHDLPSIIAAEFDEQPGLRLTFPQVRRLWDLSDDQCQHVLEYLISEGVLIRDGGGRFCRPSSVQSY